MVDTLRKYYNEMSFLLILAFMINTEEFLWYILWEYLCVFDAQLLFLGEKVLPDTFLS